MWMIILGLTIWCVAHFLKVWAPARRAALADAIGALPAKLALAVVLLIATVLMVKGYKAADYSEIWSRPPFLRHINNLLMIVAVFFYISGQIPSVVRRRIRHGQLTGTKVWALAHLLVNGDLASIVLFGGILAWAVLMVIGINKRDGKPSTEPKATALGLVIHLVGTLVVFGVIAMIHNWAGVWPFPGTAP
jgi:uncharacterized membrane protein